MRRSRFIIISLLVMATMILSACSPAATPTEAQPAAPTAAVQEEQPAADEGLILDEVNPAEVTGNIITAGSSTVYPLSEAMVNLFVEEGYTGNITVDSIGSGAGFERFCTTGETDIANASRAIKDSEVDACQAIGRSPIEFRVGTDALAIVVNPQNDFLTSVSLEELAMIFSPEAQSWSDVNPEWPAEPIKRYAPGTDSGTYDFFIEAVMQPAYEKDADKAMEAFQGANPQQSEDDNVLVQGISGDPYAIGFFGYAYYQENEDNLKILSVNDIAPGLETAESGEYVLARPLFIYSDAQIMQEKPQVASFISFYLNRVDEVVQDVGYFPASDDAMDQARQALQEAVQ